MITVKLEKLQLSFPDSFTPMGDEEKEELRLPYEGDQNICLKDENRNIFVSMAHQKLNGFGTMMLKTSSISGRMEKQTAGLMKRMAYKPMGGKERVFAHGRAAGFAYAYVAGSIPMYAESYAMKDGRDCYRLRFYTREENRNEFEKFISGVFSLLVLEL